MEPKKKGGMADRMEWVYEAVQEGHGFDLAQFLGMKYYALQKLEKAGRIRKEHGEWVVT